MQLYNMYTITFILHNFYIIMIYFKRLTSLIEILIFKNKHLLLPPTYEKHSKMNYRDNKNL